MMFKVLTGLLLAGLLNNPAWSQDESSEPDPTRVAVTQASASESDTRPASEAPIVIDSENNRYDLRTGVTEFNDNVYIKRGPMQIQADRGIIRQADGEMTEIELFGSPTQWRDQLEDGSIVSGEARTIFFDVVTNIVTLTGSAVIRHEQGEFTGDRLVYDLNNESLSGSGNGDNRARVIIEPGAMPDNN